MKKIFVTIMSLIVLSGCNFVATAQANNIEQEVLNENSQDVIVKVKPQENLASEEDTEVEETDITKNAVAHKKSSKQVILRFLLSMMWVIISSLIIFGILIGYKRFFPNKINQVNSEEPENLLESPKSFKEAVNLFLDKTKWD